MTLDEIQQIFFQECDEGLVAMETSFATMRDGADDAETINTVFRAVHSIKGGAGAFGHERLQDFTHHYETVLDKLRSGALSLSPALLGTIVAAFDMLADHVAAARDGGAAPADAAMLDLLGAACTPEAAVPDAAPVAAAASPDDDFDALFAMLEDPAPIAIEAAPWRLRIRPGAACFDHGAEPLLLLRELASLGAETIAVELAALPALDALDPLLPYLSWTLRVPGAVREDDIRAVFDFADGYELQLDQHAVDAADGPVIAAEPIPPVVEILAPVALPTPPTVTGPAPAPAAQTIRVDLDKLDRLVNLVGELVITQAMLAQRLAHHGLSKIAELAELDHLTRELQESTMAIRAQPMKTVFSRVPRIIRELEVETGKRVRLELDGEMTEVDKTVVERIGEPLTHLIRNAVDHGLEKPDARLAAGKPEEGVVRLSAAHQSGRIVITVTDDGRGIDRVRVRAKAIERGIMPADAVLGDEEIDNLIFAPGFSTAETISTVSGRGVGMDVVRRNVQSLGGRITIQSRPGLGSSFVLSLPLTLAVLDGMIVTVGDQTFVIPLTHIVESLRPAPGDVQEMGSGAALFDVRGVYVPMHRIAERLGVAGAEADPSKAVLIVVESGDGQAVLMVDAIIDQRQVVVKSLEANYEAVHGVAGATILGDGRVALILDVDALTARRRDLRLARAA